MTKLHVPWLESFIHAFFSGSPKNIVGMLKDQDKYKAPFQDYYLEKLANPNAACREAIDQEDWKALIGKMWRFTASCL